MHFPIPDQTNGTNPIADIPHYENITLKQKNRKVYKKQIKCFLNYLIFLIQVQVFSLIRITALLVLLLETEV